MSVITTQVVTHNWNAVWYLIFQVAIIVGCSSIFTRVVAVISYPSILWIIKSFEANATLFWCLLFSFLHISTLCHRLPWECFIQPLYLFFYVFYKLFHTVFTPFLTLFRMGGGAGGAPYQFFPCSFCERTKLAPKTFWLLVLTFLADWCKVSSLQLVPVPTYWTSTKTTRQKKRFLWSNLYKIDVMITSLIQMVQLPNFGHMTKPTI